MAGYGDTHFLRQDQPQNIPDRRLDFRYHNLTFTGEDSVCATAVVSQYVIAEGCGGKLYGLDAATGQQVWLADPGPPPSWNFTSELPLQGLTAGDGVLLVPTGSKLIAYTLATSP